MFKLARIMLELQGLNEITNMKTLRNSKNVKLIDPIALGE